MGAEMGDPIWGGVEGVLTRPQAGGSSLAAGAVPAEAARGGLTPSPRRCRHPSGAVGGEGEAGGACGGPGRG